MIGNELTPKQGVVNGLLASGMSITKASQQAKVSEATIYRWLALPHFKSALNQARDDIRKQASDLLKSQILKSVETIIALRDDELVQPQHRLKAAQIVLDFATKPSESTLSDFAHYDLREFLSKLTNDEIIIMRGLIDAVTARDEATAIESKIKPLPLRKEALSS